MTGGSVLSKANRPIRIDNQVAINLDLRLAKQIQKLSKKEEFGNVRFAILTSIYYLAC